jgi:hypothetical protein
MSNTNPTGCGSITTTVYEFTTSDAGKTSGCATGNMPIGNNGVGSRSRSTAAPTCPRSSSATRARASCRSSTSPSPACPQRGAVCLRQGPKGIGSGSLHTSYYTTGQPTDPHHSEADGLGPECHNDKFQDNTNITKICWQSD